MLPLFFQESVISTEDTDAQLIFQLQISLETKGRGEVGEASKNASAIPEDFHSTCYPVPPGPTGCPSNENLRISGKPNTQVVLPTSRDCYDHCIALCPPIIAPCTCDVWTYNTLDKMCYIFKNDNSTCYQAIPEERWVSGALCEVF